MNTGARFAAVAAVLLAVPSSGGSAGVRASWPEGARRLAEAAVGEYGEPDAAVPDRLTWGARRPWTRIEVFRDAVSSERPARLLEAVPYAVPTRRWRVLNAFDRGVTYDPVRVELVARTDSEATNLLALNLADEVVQGRRTPADAERFFDETSRLLAAGGASSYAARLMFLPALRKLTGKEAELGADLRREIDALQERR